MRRQGSFFGKYRGIVKSNEDPEQRGRVRALVPDVFQDQVSGWALPSFPFAGPGMGFFALPDVGAWVWVEFEQGDPEYPIWTGCFWENPEDVPPILKSPPYQKVLLQTKGGHSIVLDDTADEGGITLTAASAGKLSITPQGVILETEGGDKLSLTAEEVTLQTAAGDKLSFSPTGTTLQTADGQVVTLAPTGVEVNNGTGASVKLTGPQVSLNDGGLAVV